VTGFLAPPRTRRLRCEAEDSKFDSRMEQVCDALLSARKGTVRSAPYHFMRQHHDELTTLFAEMPSAWEPLAERFGSMGSRTAAALLHGSTSELQESPSQPISCNKARRARPP